MPRVFVPTVSAGAVTRRRASRAGLALAVLATVLGACVAPPPPRRAPPPQRVVAPPPAPVTDVVAYPSQGQSEQQLDRDRYECHLWAVKQSGFDPSVPGVPAHQQVRVVRAPPGPPPGAEVVGGAVTGAVLGAVIAGPRDAGGGAAVGALAGAAVGAVAESARADQRRQEEEAVADRHAARNAAADQQAGAYRRAISACLEGRGYTVR